MKIGTRLLKRLVALLMVLLLSIENFAAIVSDNDGSAFITKAEFDSLKNDFQSQIDQYNTSIDSKIDGAIASYLAGISVSKKESRKLVLGSWNNVTMFNYALANVWQTPNLNLSYDAAGYSGDGSGWLTIWNALSKVSYARPNDTYCRRIVVNAGYEPNPNEYVSWCGYARNWVDYIKLTRALTVGWGDEADLAGILDGNGGTFEFCNIMNLKTGYFNDANLDTYADQIWEPYIRWQRSNESQSRSMVAREFISTSNALSCSLGYVNNRQYDFEHILNWDNYNQDQVSDVNWNHTLNVMDGNNSSARIWKNVLDQCTKRGTWWCTTTSNKSKDKRTLANIMWGNKTPANIQSYWSGARKDENSKYFVAVGLLDASYDSWHIYQSDTTFKDEYGGMSFESRKLSLLEGLPLLASKVDDKINIELEFDNAYRNGTAVTNMDCDVFLSLVPFGEGSTVTDETKRIRCDGQDADKDYMTTTNNKIKLEWTMPEDGIVYIKWRPHDTTGTWQVDLDFTKNPTYIVESATF